MTTFAEWQIETILMRDAKTDAALRVLRIIRERFVPRERIDETIEQLRLPQQGDAHSCPIELSVCAYNQALDSVKGRLAS